MLNARKPARRIAAVASMTAGLMLCSAVTATADEPPSGGAEQCFPNVICAGANSGGKTPVPGSTAPAGGGGGGSDSGPQVCSYHGVPWACHDPQWGWFDSGQGCYFRPLDNPPPAGASEWGGHDPKDGALYSKVCPQTGGGQDGAEVVFMANGRPGQAPIDLARLKQQAFDRVAFPQPKGRVKPDGTAVVNSPVWLWAEGAVPPKPGVAEIPGVISVTVTPRLVKADWDFGNGLKTTCATAGTPYDDTYGPAESPDCGYRFTVGSGTRKSGVFDGTVTTYWEADVVVTGPNPDKYTLKGIRRQSAVFALRVAEMQVLN
ncbi:hypothetical protein ACFQ6N_06315 [Kitasatospora sp. NPDC056446]|uniref:hypothetical protein n=1 Tax=Kitasatospora sp. NPDC056446 TaxID=3345819 RepID=UPI0036C03484